jgi:amidase
MAAPHGRIRAFIRRPTPEQLVELGAKEFLRLTPAEAVEYAGIIDGFLSEFDRLDELPQPLTPLKHWRRDPGRTPTPEEDPFNAFIRVCRVEGTGEGPLAGLRAGVKDSIAVAGVPVSNGSRTAPYVPTTDAVVIERLLDAGASIVGKLNMDDFAVGAGETSAWGPARNPYDPRRSAGGSSGGTGSAVASGAIDLGLGADNGGSGRIPAAYCGVVSLKPTHGLIPSHGVTYLDHTFDAMCPTARTVELAARMTDVVSGHDDRDPQWVRATPVPTAAVAELGRGVEGLRIGVVRESTPNGLCEPGVCARLRDAADALVRAGAEVQETSLPMWADSLTIAAALWVPLWWAMVQSEGQGFGHLGAVDVERVHAFALSRRWEADEFPPFMKLSLLLGRYLHEAYFSVSLAKAQNLRAELRRQMDAQFASLDLLLTPTTPQAAPVLLAAPASDTELLNRAMDGPTSAAGNTVPLNLTGHPALAVPSGLDEKGMPVSVQIVARHFQDALTFRAAEVIEAQAKLQPPRFLVESPPV